MRRATSIAQSASSKTTDSQTPPTETKASRLKNSSRGLGINAAWNYGNTVFVIAVGLLLTPYQLARLGVDSYGVLMLELALVALATLANTSLVKVAVIKGGGEGGNDWTTIDLFARVTVAGLCLASIAASLWLLPCLSIPDHLLPDAKILLLILSAGQALSILVVSSQARLMLAQRFDLLNKALIVGQLVQSIGIVILFEGFHASLILNGVAVLVGAAVSRLLIWHYTRGAVGRGLPSAPLRAREVAGIWGSVAGQQICAVLSMQGLQIGANYYGGPAANAAVGLLFVVRGAVGRLNDGVANAVFAALAVVYPTDQRETKRIWCVSTRTVVLLCVPFVLALLLTAKPLAAVWLGKNSLIVAGLLPLVAMDIGLPAPALISVQLLQLSRLRVLLFVIDLVMAVLIVAGVVVAGSLGRATPAFLFLIYAGLRSVYGMVLLFGIGPRVAFATTKDVLAQVVTPVLKCSVPAALAIALVQWVLVPKTALTSLIYSALAAGVVFVPLVWEYGLEHGLRQDLLGGLGRRQTSRSPDAKQEGS